MRRAPYKDLFLPGTFLVFQDFLFITRLFPGPGNQGDHGIPDHQEKRGIVNEMEVGVDFRVMVVEVNMPFCLLFMDMVLPFPVTCDGPRGGNINRGFRPSRRRGVQ